MMSFDGLVFLALSWGALALGVWAFVDALIRPAAGFVAAGKLTKPGWAAITGIAALVMLGVGMTQGERLDWFDSSLVCWLFGAGLALLAVFLVCEWFHPQPFVKLQLLHRRNLGLG